VALRRTYIFWEASKGHTRGLHRCMIRPVLNVDLPGIVHALDTRARARQGEFANFVVAPDVEEPRSGLAALLSAFLPITPSAHTWICEDHWRLLGLAQARQRPGAQAWDLAYLAAILPSPSAPQSHSQYDVLMELAQYALNAAIGRGVHRFFVRVDDERPELELFGKLSFQRYAQELTYWLDDSSEGLRLLERAMAHGDGADPERPALSLQTAPAEEDANTIRPDVPLRRWHQHDAWGLLRLYDACTPKVVQLAESLTNDELLHTRAAGGRTWHLPLVEPESSAFVNDRGVRLGGWLRLRHGRGSQPHMLSLMAHPDDPGVALALLRFGLRVLAQGGPRPVFCQAREYETATVDALRAAGFAHTGTHALLVRHLTMRALRTRDVPAVEARMAYGVRGYGTTPSRLSKGEKTQYARTEAR
jgi:hypothetical protein